MMTHVMIHAGKLTDNVVPDVSYICTVSVCPFNTGPNWKPTDEDATLLTYWFVELVRRVIRSSRMAESHAG